MTVMVHSFFGLVQIQIIIDVDVWVVVFYLILILSRVTGIFFVVLPRVVVPRVRMKWLIISPLSLIISPLIPPSVGFLSYVDAT